MTVVTLVFSRMHALCMQFFFVRMKYCYGALILLVEISYESGACCEDLVGWLVDRLGYKSCHIKLKVRMSYASAQF